MKQLLHLVYMFVSAALVKFHQQLDHASGAGHGGSRK